jgi:hypothetical protein
VLFRSKHIKQKFTEKDCVIFYGSLQRGRQIYKETNFIPGVFYTTENYECMVIDNKTQSNKLEDQVFWYKASEANFRMCSPDLWELQTLEEQRQEMGYQGGDADEEEPFDSGVFTKKKNTNIIKVKKKAPGKY